MLIEAVYRIKVEVFLETLKLITHVHPEEITTVDVVLCKVFQYFFRLSLIGWSK